MIDLDPVFPSTVASDCRGGGIDLGVVGVLVVCVIRCLALQDILSAGLGNDSGGGIDPGPTARSTKRPNSDKNGPTVTTKKNPNNYSKYSDSNTVWPKKTNKKSNRKTALVLSTEK